MLNSKIGGEIVRYTNLSKNEGEFESFDSLNEKSENPEETNPVPNVSAEASHTPQRNEPSLESIFSTTVINDASSVPAESKFGGEINLDGIRGPESNNVDDRNRLKHSSFRTKNIKSNEFRREYSKDHPLAGGKGEYSDEKSKGLVPLGCHSAFNAQDTAALEEPPRRVSVVKTELIVEPVRQFLKYKQDLEHLFRQVLEEEELAEQDRLIALSSKYEEKDELEMITRAIQEDRARASLRIKAIADENEKKLKEALAYLLLEGEDNLPKS